MKYTMNKTDTPEVMWRPSPDQIANSNLTKFIDYLKENNNLVINDYTDLYQWSINSAPLFWQAYLKFSGIKTSQSAKDIFIRGRRFQESRWFVGAKLNFAENLLRYDNDRTAILFTNEQDQRRTISYSELRQAVAKTADYLRSLGVQENDRVAAVMPNMPETIITMLATASLGAIWSSCSPDFGKEALFDRINQIRPKILLSTDGYFYNGKVYSNDEKLNWLQSKIDSIQEILLVTYTDQPVTINATNFKDILEGPHKPLHFKQLPFDHPVYIMYSSGTTDVPKCIVHGAGGTLIQHLKELSLHTNIDEHDKVFYYTTCGWMMWNWYVSALALGATIVQYEGSPLYPTPTRLLDFIAQEKITVFGTSAKYISTLHKQELKPIDTHDLSSLRVILSTGSPLVPSSYDYVYQDIKADICLSSISGGTDIISCFALGNSVLPVYKGELQSIGLGMAVKIFNDQGQEVIGEKGELVCTQPFPSMPIYFWNDPEGEKYFNSYFAKYENVWRHGDYAEITPRKTMIIYGRSDAVLNPGGVRIGTAEIYRPIEQIPEIMDSLTVSQEWKDDNRIILFVVMKEGEQLTPKLKDFIKQSIKEHCSPRHVPAKIIAVSDLPRTLSGKLVELAVHEIIHHREVKNIAAIANPESLAYFENIDELNRD